MHQWPKISNNVGFAISTRSGGVSKAPYDSLNLGLHVDDSPADVLVNRQRVQQMFNMPVQPAWLEQVHGTKVVTLPLIGDNQADASYSNIAKQVCVVMTADCLPVLLCDRQGTEVAAIHAGWRGLCAGIIEQTVTKFTSQAKDILALTGPAIGPLAFEVGAEVRQAFIEQDPQAKLAFKPGFQGKYWGNLEMLACQRLKNLGIEQITCLSECTFSLTEKYFSYRKAAKTGRFASFIWLKA